MSKWRWTVNWTGFAGAPGYTHFITGGVSDGGDSTLALQALRTFISGWVIDLPNDIALSIEPTISELDDNTGKVIGISAFDPGSAFAGQGTGNYMAASGIVLIWHTGLYRNGREVRGRSFIVPCNPGVFSQDTGAPASAAASRWNALALTFASNVSGGLFVESVSAQPRFTHVVGGTLSPRGAVLRSRRQ